MFKKGDRVGITYYDLYVSGDEKVEHNYTVEDYDDGLLKVVLEPTEMNAKLGGKPRTIVFNIRSFRLLKIELF